MSEGLQRKLPGLALGLIVVVYLTFGSLYVAGERLNLDEGWYLYAARLVHAGQRPYVDFAYVQPPLLPYVYSLAGAFGSVEAGRNLSLLCGALAVLSVGLAAWVAEGAVAGLTAAGLLAFCSFALSQQCLVKAYALANLLVAAGLLLALAARGRRGWLVAAGVALAGAALTRNSVAPVLLAYWLAVAAHPERRRRLPWAVLGGVAPLVVGLLPFALADPAAVRYNLFAHHAEQSAAHGELPLPLLLTVITIAMVAACPALSGLLLAGAAHLRRTGEALDDEARTGLLLCGAAAALTFLGHFVSEHPYQEYQVLALPPACLLAGLLWGRIARLERLAAPVLAAVVGVVPLLVLYNGLGSLAGHKPGPDGRLDPAGVHGPLRRVAAIVATLVGPRETIFTFQIYVAIEARRPLSPGLTLGPFSFSGDADAPQRHLVNAASITATFERAEPAVVVLSPGDLDHLFHGRWTPARRIEPLPSLTGASLATYAPLLAALDRHYRWVDEVPNVGQFFETLSILARRAP